MDSSLFKPTAPGRLVRTVEGAWAFVPDPLPPDISLDLETVNKLSRATHALGELNGVVYMLPNPSLLLMPFVKKEALVSSRIEGSRATAQDLALFEIEQGDAESVSDAQEVSNYVRALRHGQAGLKKLPFCLRLIQEMHEILLTDVRGDNKRPGQFRTIQNFIGYNHQIRSARFVPPPPSEIPAALDLFEKYMHARDPLPHLVRIALLHYQFETIHPFLDGNGRIGRLLIMLHMLDLKLLSEPMLYLSAYFERNRDTYVDRLLGTSTEGDWKGWIDFFLDGVADQATDSAEKVQTLLDLQREFHQSIRQARISALLPKLVDHLFEFPAITISGAARLLGVAYNSARKLVDKLVEAKILQEFGERNYRKVYIAPKILSLIEADTVITQEPSRTDGLDSSETTPERGLEG
ncbi:MAG: Fic family protein [Candidatus Xenobium sp.]|jgi:Fic family protein